MKLSEWLRDDTVAILDTAIYYGIPRYGHDHCYKQATAPIERVTIEAPDILKKHCSGCGKLLIPEDKENKMDKRFYALLAMTPSHMLFANVWKDDDIRYHLVVWMTGWNAFIVSVEDYTEEETAYRVLQADGYEHLERLLASFELSVSSLEQWHI